MNELRCENCGTRWESEFFSDDCPACGTCSHYWELGRGECSWCFGGLEYCSNCQTDVQHHEANCPLQPEEERPEDEILVGTIHLKAWRMENRRQPFEVASSSKGVRLTPSARSGWQYAVWVERDMSEESIEAARSLVDSSDIAFATRMAI